MAINNDITKELQDIIADIIANIEKYNNKLDKAEQLRIYKDDTIIYNNIIIEDCDNKDIGYEIIEIDMV